MEQADREHAAADAVDLSLSWAPGAGLAAGLPMEGAFLARRRLACIARVSAYEVRVVRAALREWARFQAWLVQEGMQALPENFVYPAAIVEQYVAEQVSAPTASLASWNALAWLKRHLKAPVEVDRSARPRKAPSAGAAVQQTQQAEVAEPEMLMALEVELSRMERVRDWRMLVVASALICAYACMRFGHLQRSRPVRAAEVGVWFLAYRGKQAGRAQFYWFLPRFGITGIDLAGLVWREW